MRAGVVLVACAIACRSEEVTSSTVASAPSATVASAPSATVASAPSATVASAPSATVTPPPSAPSASAAASSAARKSKPAKCATGEVLILGRYEPLCAKKCVSTVECGQDGPCETTTAAATGDPVKVCEATGYPPK